MCVLYCTFVLTGFCLSTLSCAHKEGSFEHLHSSKSFALSFHPISWKEDECIRHVALNANIDGEILEQISTYTVHYLMYVKKKVLKMDKVTSD